MNNTPVNRDLLSYEPQQPPKLKKDWEGKLLRVYEFPPLSRYDVETRKTVEYQEPLVPNGAVLDLHKRYTDGGPHLVCNWPCPCCGQKHERIIPESYVTEGKANFVECVGISQFENPIIYLASPYSHPEADVREQRWLAAAGACAWLLQRGLYVNGLPKGYTVISQVSMVHPIAVMGGLHGFGRDYTTWQRTSMAMLESCTHLVLLLLEGWSTSDECKKGVDYARKLGLPVWALSPQQMGEEPYLLNKNADCRFEVPHGTKDQ